MSSATQAGPGPNTAPEAPGRARAFGKIIVAGEHAVVYGQPALAFGFGPVVTAIARPGEPGPVRMNVPALGLEITEGAATVEARALHEIAARLGVSGGGLVADAESPLPLGAGLGTSAALAYAVAQALAIARSARPKGADAIEASFAAERVFHGNPSGVDTVAAAHGGIVLFNRGDEAPPWAAGLGTPRGGILPGTHTLVLPEVPGFKLVAVHTGRAKRTAVQIAGVAGFLKTREREAKAILAEIGVLTWEATLALTARNWPALGRLLSANHECLLRFGLGCPEFAVLRALAEREGALGFKLTGAGAGGCAIVLHPGEEQRLAGAFRAAGFAAWVVEPAFPDLGKPGPDRA